TPSEQWDRFGCEDPRITYFEGTYVIFYTALGGYPFGPDNIKAAMATSRNLYTVDEKFLVTPFNAKAMALFPERINKKVTVILSAHTDWTPEHPRSTIAIAQCNSLEELHKPTFWDKWHNNLDKHALRVPLRSPNDHIEVGAPPIKTKWGWLLVYSYIQNYFGGGERVFGVEALLLDLKDPRKVVGSTNGSIIVPETAFEQFGIVPNIVFPSGALLDGNRLDIYYGGADTVCARASLHLPDLLDAMIPERRKVLGVRAKNNPIIAPISDHPWESKATFNAGTIDIDGTVNIVYRALGEDNTSTLGLALSKNGTTITKRLPEPIYAPRADFETKRDGSANSGCEDPRITRIGTKLYMAYTAFNGVDPWHVALTSISVKDFVAGRFDKWSTPEIVTPTNVKDKDGCVFPGKVGGQYMLIHRVDVGGNICADLFDTLDFSTQQASRCIDILNPRPGMWDSEKVGVAGVPIKTKHGWLMIYHGVSHSMTYRLGAALLDLDDPSIILARTHDPIFEPVEQYEKTGTVAHVVFSCGSVLRGDKLFVYYGGADRVVGVATFSLKKLLAILMPPSLNHTENRRLR
ncbi:MAG TPA: hypothetical protein VF803_01840, partial [Candidatus Paceibacterota bacterium]